MSLYKCRLCLIDKPRDEFYQNKSYASGYTSSCKSCDKLTQHKYRCPTKAAMRKFKISQEQAEYYTKAVLCEICGGTTNKTMCVDHNHTTGKLRGALCNLCNLGLGYFRDNPKILTSAINYLEKYD